MHFKILNDMGLLIGFSSCKLLAKVVVVFYFCYILTGCVLYLSNHSYIVAFILLIFLF